MSAIPDDSADRDLDPVDHDLDSEPDPLAGPPGRTWRRFFNRKTATPGALVASAAGFLGGVQVEKSQLSSNASAATIAGAGAGAGAAGAGAGGRAGFRFGAGAAGAGAQVAEPGSGSARAPPAAVGL